jgi:cobalt/nickel transport system ATP-binding protein
MLHVTDLVIDYPDGTRAVDALSFSLTPGETVALIGANGAGKTSLLLGLVGILPSTSGEIVVAGQQLTKKTLREVRAKVGLVFQDPDDQLFMPTVGEDVAFGPRSFGCDDQETAARVESALAGLSISHLASRSPLKLSAGEKRLGAIATVLSMKPELLLFDEPTAFLDPKARRNLITVMSELPQAKLIATHDLDFARQVCSRVLLIEKGKLITDTGLDLLDDPVALESSGL